MYVICVVYKLIYILGKIIEEILLELEEMVLKEFVIVVYFDFFKRLMCGIIC